MTDNRELMYMINQAMDEARRDVVVSFFTKYKTTVTVVALTTLMLGVITFFTLSHKDAGKKEYSRAFYKILADKKNGQSQDYQLNLTNLVADKSVPDGIKSLASMKLASNLLAQNKKEEARKLYQSIAHNSNYDDFTRGLASLLVAQILIEDVNEVNKAIALTEVQALENNTKAFKLLITEQRGILEFKTNNLAKSSEIFNSIANDAKASEELKDRARNMIGVISSKT